MGYKIGYCLLFWEWQTLDKDLPLQLMPSVLQYVIFYDILKWSVARLFF